MDNQPINPMNKAHTAPHYLARTRSGKWRQAPAIRSAKRCRMHGGKGSGAPKGNGNAWKHGARSQAMIDLLADLQAKTDRREHPGDPFWAITRA
jgi:glucans biosynthesis protein